MYKIQNKFFSKSLLKEKEIGSCRNIKSFITVGSFDILRNESYFHNTSQQNNT